MKFIKYPSLTNHYAVSEKEYILHNLNKLYYATEKIHGTNIQLAVDNTGEVRVGKRTSFVTDEKPYCEVYKMTEHLIEKIKEEIANRNLKQIILYGELFGAKIQKTSYDVNSEKRRDVRFYECFILNNENELIASMELLNALVPENMITPVIKKGTLKDLLQNELPSKSIYGGNECEGYVYKPLVQNYLLGNRDDSIFYPCVKHKRAEFLEVKKTNKIELGEKDLELISLINNYITENRVLNVLSHGEVELSHQNIGQLIILVQEDIKKELLSENSWVEENQLHQRLRKSSKRIVDIIKKMLLEKHNDFVNER